MPTDARNLIMVFAAMLGVFLILDGMVDLLGAERSVLRTVLTGGMAGAVAVVVSRKLRSKEDPKE